MIDLNNEIYLLNQKLNLELPQEFSTAFQQSIEDFNTGNNPGILKKGRNLPPFSLLNTKNETTSSTEILKENNSLVIAFFRGSWCPYCNLELKSLQEIYPTIKNKNSELVAISPQNSKFNSELKECQNLSFPLLTDTDNTYAQKLGITVTVQDFVLPYYEKLGVSFEEYNGNTSHILPAPAVIIINSSHYISYSFFDVNYMNRVNLGHILTHI